jgi:hypothetical protein
VRIASSVCSSQQRTSRRNIVRLAAEHGVPAPHSRAIYPLGREKFHPGFKPLACKTFWLRSSASAAASDGSASAAAWPSG